MMNPVHAISGAWTAFLAAPAAELSFDGAV
jgi:hypothetical protein